MNRSRTNQLLKIEKENENKDIKKKQRTVQAKVYSGVLSNTTTSNAERVGQLSGKQSIKYIRSRSRGGLFSNEPRTSYHQTRKTRFNTSATYHNEAGVESTDTYVKSIGIFPNHKKLGPYMAPTPGPKPRLGGRQIKRQANVISLPTFDEKKQEKDEILLLSGGKQREESMMEIYTSRNTLSLEESSSETKNVCDQRSSAGSPSKEPHDLWKKCKDENSNPISGRSRRDKFSSCSDSSTYLNLDLDLCSLNSPHCENEVFFMAPLLSVPHGNSSSNTSATLERKFRDALDDKRNTMAEDDIKVVKDVLKTDERHSLLKTSDTDPQLFKDILKTQLEEIIRNERVVKSALKKLGATPRVTTRGSLEILEIAELLSLRNKRLSENNTNHKSKKKQTNIQNNTPSENTSPRRRPYYEMGELAWCTDASSDTQSAKDLPTQFEKRYEYSDKGLKKTKQGKRARSADPQKEYERSPLPRKQKVTMKKLENKTAVVECPSQVEMQLHIDDDMLKEEVMRLKPKSARRPQVDVTFKNVPSLEKEILILRALGERLEATLKRTMSEPSLSDIDKKREIQPASSMSSLTKELQKIDSTIEVYPGRQSTLILKPLTTNKLMWCQKTIGCVIYAKGLRLEIGVVNEFIIVSKTLDELKSDANSNFYIPKSGKLQCTSFAKLKTEPGFLLQNIKPKSIGQPFNILDHDPVFFNSFLIPALTNETIAFPKMETSSKDSGLTETVVICEGGDSLMAATEGIKKATTVSEPKLQVKKKKFLSKKSKEQTEKTEEQLVVSRKPSRESSQSVKVLKSSQLPRSRSRPIRRVVTPMPFDAFDEPKNNLLKKVLIGVVQVSIFLGLIMALTLPDIKC